MKKSIVLVGTFDSKSQEYLYVKDLIERNNCSVVTVDIGTGLRGTPLFAPDYSKEYVAEMAGSSLQEVMSFGNSGQILKLMETMSTGAIKICRELLEAGRLDGIFSLGGTMGTNLGTTIMRSLPFGLPKVMVSTIASGDTRPFVGTKDIVMVPSIADIAGLNRITENSLTKAAGAIIGMVSVGKPESSERFTIGITTLGSTTKCALQVIRRLEKQGFEGIIFHANGAGGKSMEELVEEEIIRGVFDLSTNEVVDHLYGGWGDAGESRLEIAGRKGIPQLVAPGNLDHVIYSRPEQIPERFKGRYIHRHGPSILVIRTRKKEMIEVGKVIAEKLNKAKGPTAVIIPLRGLSILDKIAEGFDDPEANEALFETLSQNIRSDIPIKRVDAHVLDSAFAEEAAQILYRLVGQTPVAAKSLTN
jgi:uncharacterized protein (UPF0261 family)